MTFSYPSDHLLDRCGCGIHNKEDTTFSCPSDDLLDRYGSNIDILWSSVGETLKEKNINVGTNYIQLVSCKGVNIGNIGDKWSFKTQIKKGSSFETEDKKNPAGNSYKCQRTEGENMKHSDNKNFFNTQNYMS
ncbi:22076_t:CDS:2 [Entrophospora sp. SA101]|nr:22076_t:CDS:2 [Entrophospora sp. SA101]